MRFKETLVKLDNEKDKALENIKAEKERLIKLLEERKIEPASEAEKRAVAAKNEEIRRSLKGIGGLNLGEGSAWLEKTSEEIEKDRIRSKIEKVKDEAAKKEREVYEKLGKEQGRAIEKLGRRIDEASKKSKKRGLIVVASALPAGLAAREIVKRTDKKNDNLTTKELQ